MAILYGMTLDTDNLFLELGQLKQCLSDQEYAGILLHVLLSGQYENSDDLFEDILQTVDVLSISGRAEALGWLNQHGYDDLALRVAQNLSADPIISKELIIDSGSETDPLERTDVFERLSALHKQTTLVEFQQNHAIKEAILQEEEHLLDQAAAIILASKLTTDNTGQHSVDWQKIVALVPESDLAKAELAIEWIQNGEAEKADALTIGNSVHPLVQAVKAFLAARQGNTFEADLLLEQLKTSLHVKTDLSRSKTNQIVRLISQIESNEKVEQVLKSLPYGMAAQEHVMGLLAKQNFKTGKFDKAKKYAQATLLMNDKDMEVKRLLAHTFETEGDFASAMKIWDGLTTDTEQLRNEDLHSLAACAIRSNAAEKAIETCKSLVERSPADGEAFVLLGDAYQQLGDYPQAQESYEKAISSSPELENAWIKLRAIPFGKK